MKRKKPRKAAVTRFDDTGCSWFGGSAATAFRSNQTQLLSLSPDQAPWLGCSGVLGAEPSEKAKGTVMPTDALSPLGVHSRCDT